MKLRHIIYALIVLPFVEFWFFGIISTRLGLLPSLALLIGLSFGGIALLKAEGKRLLEAFKSGETIHFSSEATKHGLMTGIGGLLLALPGFLSDIAAFFFLFPYFKSFLLGERVLSQKQTAPNIIDLTPEQWHEKLEPTATNHTLPKQ
jgi:UPF0716 protein FxsA